MEKANLLLETQVAPFRALALDKYTLPEAQALAKLAVDYTLIQEQLNQYISKIRNFEVVVEINIVANWTTEQANFSFMTTGSILSVFLKLQDNRELQVEFVPSEPPNVRASPDTANIRTFTYRTEARKGDPIFDIEMREILTSERTIVNILGADKLKTSDHKITVNSFNAIFYINGEVAHIVRKSTPTELILPEKTSASYILTHIESIAFGTGNNNSIVGQ